MNPNTGVTVVLLQQFIITTLLLAISCAAPAATPLLDVRTSPDVTLELTGGTIGDEELARDELTGNVIPVSFLGIPANADIVGHHLLPGGDRLLAMDTAVELPAPSGSLATRKGDVVRFDGTHYTLEFDANGVGLPAGTFVDAVSRVGPDLLLSFDITVHLNPGDVVADDEDLVLWDGATFTLFWDGSNAGVDPALDLDAAHWINSVETLLVSFDNSGVVDGTAFDDEDLLEHDPTAAVWQLAYDASAKHAAWGVGADLDAASGSTDPDEDGLSDIREAERGTNPLSEDTDADGLSDGVESGSGLFVDGTDTGTDPLLSDTDGDGWSDGAEAAMATDPVDSQSFPGVIPADDDYSSNLLKIIIWKAALDKKS